MRKYVLILLLILSSCKLFESKDTTDPIVNLTIDGGNEISREVTLYLDIEDNSKIDYVDIIIDDTTAATVTSNFDTIRFDVTPFADESEHQLYAKVADSEGNIGESEKLDVVITEFPGWREYLTLESYVWDLLVDDNGLLWIGYWDKVHIFDHHNNITREITNSDTPEFVINDMELIEGSRVWIATDHHVSEYHYDIDKWLKVLPTPTYGLSLFAAHENWCIAVDDNYDLYIGTNGNYILKYNGGNSFTKIVVPGATIYDMKFDTDGNLYYFPQWSDHGSYIKNDQVYNYDTPFDNYILDRRFLIIDIDGNLWVEGRHIDNLYGCYVFDGSNWVNKYTNNPSDIIYPILGANDGSVYSIAMGQDSTEYKFISHKDNKWIYWNELDTPIQIDSNINRPFKYKRIDEAPNGDIWMILGNELWRYRPSLGGYP